MKTACRSGAPAPTLVGANNKIELDSGQRLRPS
jgi:hypothetical protein